VERDLALPSAASTSDKLAQNGAVRGETNLLSSNYPPTHTFVFSSHFLPAFSQSALVNGCSGLGDSHAVMNANTRARVTIEIKAFTALPPKCAGFRRCGYVGALFSHMRPLRYSVVLMRWSRRPSRADAFRIFGGFYRTGAYENNSREQARVPVSGQDARRRHKRGATIVLASPGISQREKLREGDDSRQAQGARCTREEKKTSGRRWLALDFGRPRHYRAGSGYDLWD
jgi:hypothetical protein